MTTLVNEILKNDIEVIYDALTEHFLDVDWTRVACTEDSLQHELENIEIHSPNSLRSFAEMYNLISN